MSKLYVCTANVIKKFPDGTSLMYEVPTFLLNADVQGITDKDHAERIITEVVNPTHDATITVSPCAVEWKDV